MCVRDRGEDWVQVQGEIFYSSGTIYYTEKRRRLGREVQGEILNSPGKHYPALKGLLTSLGVVEIPGECVRGAQISGEVVRGTQISGKSVWGA